MTEHPFSTDPAAGPDPADTAWFRATFDPIADGPATDTWSDLERRLDGGPTPIPLRQHATARRAPRLLAVAAVLLVIAGAVAVIVASNRPEDQHVAGGGPPSGFYLPGPVPEGWTVEIESGTSGGTNDECPCTSTTFTRGDGRLIASETASDTGASEGGTATPVEGLPDGEAITTSLADDPTGANWVHWRAGDRYRYVISADLPEDVLIAFARAWGAEPGATPPATDGFAASNPLVVDGTTSDHAEARWRFIERSTGKEVDVGIGPATMDLTALLGTESTLENGYRVRSVDGADTTLMGLWPGGAQIQVTSVSTATFTEVGTAIDAGGGSSASGSDGTETTAAATATSVPQGSSSEMPAATKAEMLAMVGTFRSATAAEWAAADVPAALHTASIRDWFGIDLVDPDGTGATTTVPAADQAPVIGLDGSVLDDVVVRGAAVTIPAGSTGMVRLTATVAGNQPVEVPGCLLQNRTSWLEQDGRQIGSTQSQQVSCVSATETIEPGTPQEAEIETTAPDEPGVYDLVVSVEQVQSPVTVQITVT